MRFSPQSGLKETLIRFNTRYDGLTNLMYMNISNFTLWVPPRMCKNFQLEKNECSRVYMN